MEQQRRAETNDAVRRRVRVDVLAAWTNARLKDDHIERIKREGALSIASELQKTSAVDEFSSLQERSSCEFTQAFFASFEPWMVSRLAELTTAFKTMSDGNVKLLLLQPTEQLTIGFVRDEKSLALLFDEEESDRMAWQFASGHLVEHEAESWEDLDVEDVDIVQTKDDRQSSDLESLSGHRDSMALQCAASLLKIPFNPSAGDVHRRERGAPWRVTADEQIATLNVSAKEEHKEKRRWGLAKQVQDGLMHNFNINYGVAELATLLKEGLTLKNDPPQRELTSLEVGHVQFIAAAEKYDLKQIVLLLDKFPKGRGAAGAKRQQA
ncbi:hypothetical protein BBJ29_008080 [Phytophthora kernoviae]|uniref:Uncharacterized protein n=1 Tax=Phytophthora kernoviae TaxID=325452 RepID=A0A3F2RY10_9STRA|nr:hypothetical protein BBP00_00002768 [Phytophthora kernoviae]RLN67358.1 hypothetical protein BBJ29_008080 [Phytophthora kernoviae]